MCCHPDTSLILIVTKMFFCAVIVNSSPSSVYGKQLYSIGSAFCYSQNWFIPIKKSVWRQASFMNRFSPIRTVMLGIIFKCMKMTSTVSIIRNIFQCRNGSLESNNNNKKKKVETTEAENVHRQYIKLLNQLKNNLSKDDLI